MTALPLALVTGGAGFVGGHVVRALLERGHAVRVIDLTPSPGLDGRADFIQGSVLDRPLLRQALDGVGWVFHLAANPNLWAPDKRSFAVTNVETVEVVLTEATAAGVQRIVHTSTESILVGRRYRRGDRVDETSRPDLDDLFGPYCRSKMLGELAALRAAEQGAPVVVVNPTMPIGPGDHRMTPPTTMLKGFLNGDHPAYFDFEMNLVDVRDVAVGHILAAEHGAIGERYILGGSNLSMTDLLRLLGQVSGRPMPKRTIPYALALTVAAVSEFVADHITRRPPVAALTGVRLAGVGMSISADKAIAQLGYEPRPIEAALADATHWLAETGQLRHHPA